MLTRVRSALAGRYALEVELGRGATAVVYRARDLKHGRRVALKVVEPDVVSTIGSHRFLQEIRTTARLNHPHILPLFDSGEADGFIFYTMPLVEGESLRERLDRVGRMPFQTVLPMVTQIADALSYAHCAGIIHRDIKPENIMIGGQEHVWVADFGLARALTYPADHRLTSTGIAVGSPQYMSPEQAAGESDIDGRSDVYSLACIVFEALCGDPPFTAASVSSMLARHLSDPAPSVRDRCPEVPPTVDAAIRRAMSKDRSHRFRDARDFVTALQEQPAAVTDQAAAAAPAHIHDVLRRQVTPPSGITRWFLTFADEIRRRGVHRATVAYAAGAFIAWQAADIAFPAFGLPASAMEPVVIFAIAGFPVAIVLAWLFGVTPQGEAARVAPVMAPVSPHTASALTPYTRLSGIGIRIAVISLVVLGCSGIAYSVIPRAALELPAGNRLLIADVENHTGDTIFAHALLDALRVGLAQSPHVNVVSNAQARAGMLAMRRDSISTMNESTAIELALRESIAAVLVVSIQEVGSRYTLSTRVVDPATRATLVSRSAKIEGKHDVLSGLDELARQLRSDLGESLASMVRMRVPLDRATTHSFEALRAWTEGNRNYSAGLNEEARLMWERAVELDSTFALAHADLGQYNYWHRNDPLAGERHFEAALRHSDHTTERERLMIRAKSAEWRGDRQSAASAYRTVTGLYPQDVHAWGNLGYQLLRLDRQNEAVAAYQKVVELDSTNANAWVNLATLHSMLTEYAAADEYYRRAFELAPAYRTVPNLNHEYGLNLIGLGQIEEAEHVYTLMLDQSPSQRAQGLRSIAMLRFLAGRFADAERELRQAIVVSESLQARTSELRNRGLLLESLARRGRSAERELTHAADLAESNFIASFWVHHIGVWLARASRVNDARELLDTTRARLDSDPLSAVAVMRLEAEIALAEGDTASAAERFEAALSLDPDWIVALSGLAQLRYIEGNHEQAERHLLEILKSREHSPGDENLAEWVLARYRLARIHDERGDLDAARERYDQFLALWGSGDRDVPEIASARERLRILGRRPRVGVR